MSDRNLHLVPGMIAVHHTLFAAMMSPTGWHANEDTFDDWFTR
jgi:hypothetical protein